MRWVCRQVQKSPFDPRICLREVNPLLCLFSGPCVSPSHQVSLSSAGSEAVPVSPSWSFGWGEMLLKVWKGQRFSLFHSRHQCVYMQSVHTESLKVKQVSFNYMAHIILLLKVISYIALNTPGFGCM